MLSHPSISGGAPDHLQARLGIASLDTTVRSLIDQGVARSALTLYGAGKRQYLSLCAQFYSNPLPVDGTTVLHFVAHLSLSSLSYQTVRSYLSAVRHLQIVNNLPDPSLASFSRLNFALRGLCWEGPKEWRHTRLPITLDLLLRIYTRFS